MDNGKIPQRFLWLVKNSLVGDLFREFRRNRFRRKWRKNNPHNETFAESLFDEKKVTVGKYTYGPLNVVDYGNTSDLIIGNYVSIAHGVTFLLNSDHYVNHISTFPFRVKVLKDASEVISKGDIRIDDDVWIGQNATILSGVHIGQGAVVAAGGVVSHDVLPYSIVGGVPAKVIRYRFSEHIIAKLLLIDYSHLTVTAIRTCIDELYMELNDDNIDTLMEKIRKVGAMRSEPDRPGRLARRGIREKKRNNKPD